MHVIAATEFRPRDSDDLAEPLVVHTHEEVPSRDIVIFVHGLGGSRYGTWGLMPKLVFDHFPGVDVGLYAYRTGLRRLRWLRSIPLEDEARVLADVIRDQPNCERTVLIGHSLGGILIKAALSDLIVRDESKTIARVSGLILMASPQAGSRWVPRLLSGLTKDMAVLAPYNAVLADIAQVFTDNVAECHKSRGGKRFVIPTWIVAGAEDTWVERFSSGLGVPSPRRKIGRGSHTEIVKPRDERDPTYEFVRSALAEAFPTEEPIEADAINVVLEHGVRQLIELRAANGGFRTSIRPGEPLQVWSTAQAVSALFWTRRGLQEHKDRLKKSLAYCEDQKVNIAAGGWGYWATQPMPVCEIGSWVLLSYASSFDCGIDWSEAEGRMLRERTECHAQSILAHQDRGGGFCPIIGAPPMTYASVMALWALLEVRRRRLAGDLDVPLGGVIEWLLKTHDPRLGWIPSPETGKMFESGRRADSPYAGLTAHVLFVLAAAAEQFPSLLHTSPLFRDACDQFVNGAESLVDQPLHEGNSSLRAEDQYVQSPEGTRSLEGSTFAWYPWSMAALAHLAHSQALNNSHRKQARLSCSRLLRRAAERLRDSPPTLTWELAENVLCLSHTLRQIEQ